MIPPDMLAWRPTSFHITDAGAAYVKALGNPQGPHVLACDLIGTRLAQWLGLQTFDCAVMVLEEGDSIPFAAGGFASPGPAFLTRAESGMQWSGAEDDLQLLENPEDLTRLVVFDTWTRNCDRHPPAGVPRKPNRDNVFLSKEGAEDGRFRLVAMDHGHCFTCGGALGAVLSRIEIVRDEGIFGLFPEFTAHLRQEVVGSTLDRLATLDQEVVAGLIGSLPREWEVSEAARESLQRFLLRRAHFLAAEGEGFVGRICPA